MFSMFYGQGTTSGNTRQGRGGLNTSTAFTNPDGSLRGGINEYRYTVGLDTRLRMGPFSFDPTVLYQFGNRCRRRPDPRRPVPGNGVVAGRKYYATATPGSSTCAAGSSLARYSSPGARLVHDG